jgi:addiction module RelE/StbE family toxin
LVEIRSVIWTQKFEREFRKLKDKAIKDRVRKKIREILEDPEIGKPLRLDLKGERSIRIPPYRLIYAAEGDTLYLLRFEHRKTVYN